jgi:hypothetical protein
MRRDALKAHTSGAAADIPAMIMPTVNAYASQYTLMINSPIHLPIIILMD